MLILTGSYIIDVTGQKMQGICHASRAIVLWIEFYFREWSNAIKEVMNGPGKVWTQNKRFDSFAPERNHCTATWSVA